MRPGGLSLTGEQHDVTDRTDVQRLLAESLATAGPAIRATFGGADRRLDAERLRAFWRSTRMWAVATVSGSGAPHIAPVHVQLTEDDHFEMSIFEDAVRLRDLRRDPRIAITSWGSDGTVAIAYGTATEVEGSRRAISRGAENPRFVLTMRIEVNRLYAMTPPPRPE